MSTTPHKLIVQKYGGATLATPEKIKQAALRISELHKAGTKVVVVVSAMGQTTNELIALAHQVSPRPQLREMDMLLTVGERISMSLMSMALNDLGCSAISFTGSQAGILTDEAHVNANIIDVKATRVEEALANSKIVIMAGFQGVSPVTKEITTLGRGGSDTSAVAMAGYLKADRCEILKDVDCVYTADPKLVPNAHSIPELNYTHLLEMTSWGAKVLHHRSVEMALNKNVTLYVGPAAKDLSKGTVITSSFHFAKQKAIAVNSFSQVFELSLQDSYKEFHQLLHKNQIGKPHLLFAQGRMHFIAGPDEILKSIENFEAQQDFFALHSKNVASVSLTYANATADAELNQARELLENKKIKIISDFQLMNGLHFFVPKEQRNETIQILHTLIS
jgi:aspartate kinase